ncbi:MAG TPA: MarR family winged helix-turn-helix transcriptional regulator [Acidimicrobiales bacterium]|nr:MarR family winged helix-turn-helix transcriptional regulator [Acidimicrobiales bacterium]
MISGDRHVMVALGNLMAESRKHLLAQAGSELRPSHHRVIGHVPPEGITVTELAERVGMTKQGIGQFVKQLTDSGHLRTTAHPHDKRLRIIRRTSDGDASVRQLAAVLAKLEERWAERVGRARYRQFREILDQLAEPSQ